MPTKKPILQVVLTNEYNKKLKALAELKERSSSSLGAKIIEQYIDEYEQEHGPITLPPQKEPGDA